MAIHGAYGALSSGLADRVQGLLDSGRLPNAIALCRKRIDDVEGDANAHRLLSELYAASGEPLLALKQARDACELAPEEPCSWSNLGLAHARNGKLHDAVQCFTQALSLDSRHADSWHNLGVALKKLRDSKGAFAALKNALLLDPTRAETYLMLGNLLISAEQLEDAVECFERAAKYDSGLAAARSRLADVVLREGKVKRAESLFRESLGLNPGHLQGWLGLGRTLEDIGEAEGARGAYLNVLRRYPDHAVALGQYLTLLRKEGEGDVADAEIDRWLAQANRNLCSESVEDEAKALIGYGLAKYYDRHEAYAEAAQAGIAANAARRRVAGTVDRDRMAAGIDRVIETYDADFFASRENYGVGTDQPVFIVGLPRSGTTLIEQILSAHTRLHGSGELRDLTRIASASLADEKDEPWQAADQLDVMRSREYAYQYLRALRNSAPKRQLRISDKSPLNYYQLAFAALLFPNARVIHCRRDARDNALSIWMQNFNDNQRYATNFDDLAYFHAQYRRLMTHWKEVLPLNMLEVVYEDTVADLERQARRLMCFLDVQWEAGCLDFHKNERAVQTPSRWQVRQPLYSRSVGRWRKYAEYLPQLVSAFSSSPHDRVEPG